MRPIICMLWSVFCVVLVLTGCAASPARPGASSDGPGQAGVEIVSTPFGDIERPIRPAADATVAAAENEPAAATDYETFSTPLGPMKKPKPRPDQEAPASESDRLLPGEEGLYEIVSTPFGYVKRKKKQPDPMPAAARPPVSRPPEVPARTPVVPPAEPVLPAAVPDDEAAVAADVPVPSPTPPRAKKPAPPAADVSSKPLPAHTSDESGEIRFDFDEAELDAVIRVMADFLKINYVIDPGISGKVTIHTAGRLQADDVFPIFFQTLEINGLSAVKEGNVYRITKFKEASRLPLVARQDGETEDIPPGERVVLQIIPLRFISAPEVAKIITPFVSAEGTIVSEGASNTLLVADKGVNILKILKLVEIFDISVFEKTDYRFFPLTNADAEDVAKALGEILPAAAAGAKAEVKCIPLKWLNALLAVSSSPEVLNRMDALIRQLDIPSEGAQPQIYVYSVKNGMAADLGETLRAIFGATGERITSPQRETVPTNPYARGAKGQETAAADAADKTAAVAAPPAPNRAAAGELSATLRGDIRITDDQIRNALIIEALPADYKLVQRILNRLDVLPRQVLIDVVIAEVALGQGTEMGIEWTFKKENWTDTGSLSALIGGSGLQYTLGLSEKWLAALNALANDSKLNIISSPSVLASDNKAAKIDVTTEVPIPSTNYTYVTDGDNVLETSVEYRDTGVILEVTPHINENGLVTMDISQEVSNVGSLIKVAGQDYYSFDRKKILTSLTVRHNQSIVIGGLISKEKKDAVSGVPWLTKIPVIRWLTGSEKKSESRSELIVMITPHVIISLEDVDAISDEFKRKVADNMTAFQ